jgi:hypothetical protein
MSAVALALAAEHPSALPDPLFISPSQDIAFALRVPNDASNDIYFTLAGLATNTYTAVGLGSTTMSDALVFILYASADGQNVTFSPRLSYRDAEPVLYPELRVEALPGTGLVDDSLVYAGRCANCLSYPLGALDTTAAQQPFIYAAGPAGASSRTTPLQSDDPGAALLYHASYGSFYIDMARAVGEPGAPDMRGVPTGGGAASSAGVALGPKCRTNQTDAVLVIHGVVMVLCFLGLMPFGVVVLRVYGLVRWHWINQALALGLVVVGAGLGVWDGFQYNRVSTASVEIEASIDLPWHQT